MLQRTFQQQQQNAAEEAFLKRLNDVLAPLHDAECEDLPEAYPNVFVLGTIRSGSTLLYQLLASCLDVGYVSNLAAAFWRAPLYGIRLQKKFFPKPPPSSFRSRFGSTDNAYDPHEFGYFWSEHLGFRDQHQMLGFQVDWARIKMLLCNLTHVLGKPFVHKTLLMYAFLQPLLSHFRKAWVVVIHRDVVQAAVSAIQMRFSKWGSKEVWDSLRIPGYKRILDRPYWEQVAAQVHHMERTLRAALSDCDKSNVIELTYEELCRQPREIVARLAETVSRTDCPLRICREPPESFHYHQWPESDDTKRVRDALLGLYDGHLPTADAAALAHPANKQQITC